MVSYASTTLFEAFVDVFIYFCVVGKLMEMHGESTTTTSGGKGGSTKVERSYEPPVQESV